MPLPLALIFPCLVLAGLETFQQPLRGYENQSSSPFDAQFDQRVEWALEHFSIPGLAVAVVHGDTFVKGYGVSNTISSQPVTEHTLFFTGSTTKAFTSAAISLLVDDNINFPDIHWDTPVHTIIPADFVLNDTWSTSQMTIIDILSHRSGLPRHDWVWLADITLQEVVRSMRHLPRLLRGQNGNIQISYIAQGYYVGLDGKIASTDQVFSDNIRGAGNILSSVSDYAKWISTMLKRGLPFSQTGYENLFGGHSIVSPNPLEPFQTPTLYGLGWMSQTYKGEMILFHEGAQFGYGASVILLPQRDFGLVLLGNNMDGVNAAANALAYHLIDEEMDISLESRFDWVARGDAIINDGYLSENILSELYPRIPNPPLASPVNFSAYEGSYTHPAYPELRISNNCRSDHAYQRLNRTTPDLCASLARYSDYSKNFEIGFFHVSGTYWLQIAVRWGHPSAARVEFRIEPDGSASWLGIEIEPLMAEREEKIWWKHLL